MFVSIDYTMTNKLQVSTPAVIRLPALMCVMFAMLLRCYRRQHLQVANLQTTQCGVFAQQAASNCAGLFQRFNKPP